MKSILDISVSCFRHCTAPDNPQPVNLLSWLTSDKYRDKVEQIRSIQDKETRDAIKKTLPAITPSGLFKYREVEGLTAHSGFIQFDIDFKENQNISNYSDLKDQLRKLKNIAYCGLSVSGRGFWGLIQISDPNSHKEHFQALCNDFMRFGIVLDKSVSAVSQLRIYSFDPEAYFNHDAIPYTKKYKPQPRPAPIYDTPTTGDNREKVEKIISELSLHKIDITGDYKEEWLKVASALANEFGDGGRGYFHNVSQYHLKYDSTETDKLYDQCLKKDYSKVTISTFFYIAENYGLRFKEEKRETEKFLSSKDLQELAIKHIGEFNHLPSNELIRKVGVKALTQMIDNKIVMQAYPLVNEYIIYGSTPF